MMRAIDNIRIPSFKLNISITSRRVGELKTVEHHFESLFFFKNSKTNIYLHCVYKRKLSKKVLDNFYFLRKNSIVETKNIVLYMNYASVTCIFLLFLNMFRM